MKDFLKKGVLLWSSGKARAGDDRRRPSGSWGWVWVPSVTSLEPGIAAATGGSSLLLTLRAGAAEHVIASTLVVVAVFFINTGG